MGTNEKNMTAGSPGKLIITFAIPLMLGNIFQQFYTMADTMIVGRVVGVEALAAVGAGDWLVWLVLHTMLTNSYKQGKPNLNVMFQYNMPLRALAKMTSGAISMGMVDGIVLEAKGFWGIGLCKVLVEAVKNAILNAQLEKRLRDA